MVNDATTAIRAEAPSRMPARLPGAPAGRRIAVGTAAFASSIHTPAFLKDVPGVRAWSPPV